MSRISTKFRWGLYIVFLLAFFVTAPLVVLYTAGYRYSFDANRVVQTGVLSVKTDPKGADIFIDDKHQRRRSQTVIKNIFPGEHVVRLEKSGFLPWEKTLTIQSRDTTFIADAVLFLADSTRLIREVRTETAAVDLTSGTFAFLQSGGDWVELWLIEPASEDEQLLARVPANDEHTYELTWSADGSYIALQNTSTPTENSSIIRVRDGRARSLEAHVDQAETMWWDTEDGNVLYARTPNAVVMYNLRSETEIRLPAGVQSATQQNDDLLVLQEGDSQTVVGFLDEETVSIHAYIPYGDYILHDAPSNLILAQDLRRDRVLLIDTDANERPILLNASANHWRWEHTGEHPRLLYSDGFDLHVYDPRSHRDTTLTRLSQQITDIAWHASGTVVFYAQESGLYAIEVDYHEGRNVTRLTEAPVSTVWTDTDGENAYFLGIVDGIEGIYRRILQQ